MVDQKRVSGVFAPVITPFQAGMKPDERALIRQCQWLLEQGVGLAVFGTNSEANSLSAGERKHLLDALIESGLPAGRMMPGTGCCSLIDTVDLTRHATQRKAAGVLMLPPFYYKDISDDGLFASYAEIIERVADDALRVYLYHIPQVTRVPISLDLIERLLRAYPKVIAGIKDSSGDWNNTHAMLERFQPQGFDIFSGSERFLLATLKAGGAGCISATANVNPRPIVELFESWEGAFAQSQQDSLNTIRTIFEKFPMIAAMKAVVAHFSENPYWEQLRPPLQGLTTEQKTTLLGLLEDQGFAMRGLV